MAAFLFFFAQDFPLEEGARWVYSHDGRGVTSMEVVAREFLDGARVARLRLRGERFLWMKEWTSVALVAEGLTRHSTGTGLLLPASLEESASWTGPNFVGAVLGFERVSVPLGEFEACKIQYLHTGSSPHACNYTAWFAPGTGFVKIDCWSTSAEGERRGWICELSEFRSGLEPGEEMDPFGAAGYWQKVFYEWRAERPGRYTVDSSYDVSGETIDDWRGPWKASSLSKELLEALDSMVHGRFEANRVAFVVEQ